MSKRVLVLDDDEGTRDVLQTALAYEDFIVEGLETSENIIDEIKKFQPHLIVLDYLISPLKGDEVCRMIKSNAETAELPLVMCSAHPGASKLCSDCKCDAFIEKPFDLWRVVDRIKALTHES